MTFFCVWPLIVVSLLLFTAGFPGVWRGCIRGLLDPATKQYPYVTGAAARVIGFFLGAPLAVGVVSAVIDVISMSNDEGAWGVLSGLIALVHLGAIVGCLLAAGVVYLLAPKTYEP